MQKKFQSSWEDNGTGIRLYGMNREKQGLSSEQHRYFRNKTKYLRPKVSKGRCDKRAP